MALLGVAVLVAAAAPAYAQGEQTGTLRGTVRTADGMAVPGVLVRATSTALQGQRTTASGANGAWILRNLAPGSYALHFELEGMAPAMYRAAVTLGGDTVVNIRMAAGAREAIEVVSSPPGILSQSQTSTHYTNEQVNDLPIGRTPGEIATLAPGLSTNTPNGWVTISGGFSYDNVFLIDGVDAGDNAFSNQSPVFIEDAIAELQVLTSGISAEYGRFSGGVVNVITKSGGNDFSGSLRVELNDDDWRQPTPLEKESGTAVTGPTNEDYSGTLGGYVLKDRLWFFVAGRDTEADETGSFAVTGLAFNRSTAEDRQEVKATVNIRDRHQLQGALTERQRIQTRPTFNFSATPDTLRIRMDPSELRVGRYSGVLTSALFAELQASEKSFAFRNTHGLDADETPGSASFVDNSPFFDFFGNFGAHYNAPYFDGRDPEERSNEQLAGSLSFFADSARAGSHDLEVGFEDFTAFTTGGNSQSPTSWVMSADVVTDDSGAPILTPDHKVTPVWEPLASGAWQWLADRGARVDIETRSFYVNDRWQLDDHWSFNIGWRHEDVRGESDAGVVTVDTNALVPRLGASYDLRGDGRYRFDLTWAEYAGKYTEGQFARNTNVGNPSGLLYLYLGPPGVGYDFAPAYDFANRQGFRYLIVAACDGTQNVLVDPDLRSPTVEEITLGAGMALARGGFLKLIYTDREYADFVEDFVDTTTGTTEVVVQGVSAGTFSNRLFGNSNEPNREYRALQLIGRYRLSDRWTLDGSWTHQLRNHGNFEGETANGPGISSVFGNFPEVRSEPQHTPRGALDDFAEHKIRLWTGYALDLGRAGDLNLALLLSQDSGRAFSATDNVGLTPIQAGICADLGYPDCFTSQTIYFGRRGGVRFSDSTILDFTANHKLPLWRDLDLWIKLDLFNVLDDATQTSGRTGVTGEGDGPLDSLGLPTTFTPDPDFRDPVNNASFVTPRTYRLTIGFRF